MTFDTIDHFAYFWKSSNIKHFVPDFICTILSLLPSFCFCGFHCFELEGACGMQKAGGRERRKAMDVNKGQECGGKTQQPPDWAQIKEEMKPCKSRRMPGYDLSAHSSNHFNLLFKRSKNIEGASGEKIMLLSWLILSLLLLWTTGSVKKCKKIIFLHTCFLI